MTETLDRILTRSSLHNPLPTQEMIRDSHWSPEKEKKKRKTKETSHKKETTTNLEGDWRKSVGESDRKASRGTIGPSLRLEDITGEEAELFDALVECMTAAAGHITRLKILAYCMQPRSFSDIMLRIGLNPNSLQYHSRLLQKAGLISKTKENDNISYRTSPLGMQILRILELVHKTYTRLQG